MPTKIERLQKQLTEHQEKAKAAKAALEQLRREQDRQARIADRKARTRNLIEAGGLVEIAGLLDLDKGMLLGALIETQKSRANDPQKAAAWKHAGDAELARRESQRQTKTARPSPSGDAPLSAME